LRFRKKLQVLNYAKDIGSVRKTFIILIDHMEPLMEKHRTRPCILS